MKIDIMAHVRANEIISDSSPYGKCKTAKDIMALMSEYQKDYIGDEVTKDSYLYEIYEQACAAYADRVGQLIADKLNLDSEEVDEIVAGFTSETYVDYGGANE